jgi:tyrosyl-tRNA synthetase
MTILLADIHAFLDSLKAPIELVALRAEYYRYTITAMLSAVGVSTDKLKFVLGSSYQLDKDYSMDKLKLIAITGLHDAQKAGAEVVKQSENPPLGGLIYPLMQVLDEQYLGVDAQFGGVDQRKLFTAAKEWLPKLNYKEVRWYTQRPELWILTCTSVHIS